MNSESRFCRDYERVVATQVLRLTFTEGATLVAPFSNLARRGCRQTIGLRAGQRPAMNGACVSEIEHLAPQHRLA